ncbi:penicillin-binding protein activator [Vibrio algivorus]|uniref:Penicillin-binding protein activator LpoA n=1 Tax=Vibrio algivorus TaxID=1667024 RepID=A0ABQ6ESG3_9VIBR|nr:penicillin-binding protein activator [Vibrio algivorus]GLT15966.1 penicillin-binding protein activator LpoA [Vibrio algivorus]
MQIMNHKIFSVPRLFTSIALMLLVSACSSLTSESDKVDITAPPVQTSLAYTTEANDTQPSNEQTDLFIMALKASVVEKDYDQGQSLLKRIVQFPLNDMQQAEWQLAKAQITAATVDSETALKGLNFQQQWQLADAQWRNYHQQRAKLFEDIRDFFNADREWIAYKEFQPVNKQESTDMRIWENLEQYSKDEIIQLKAQPSETELQGWLYVSTQMKTQLNNPSGLKTELQQWFGINISHPIVTHTPEDVQRILDLDISTPQNVAVLLPLSGKYEMPAKLIRDGFIHAMTDDADKDPALKMTVYDTSTQSLQDIYAQLKANNTDFIIGPLIKDNVERLQDINSDNIPMLALNFPDELDKGTQVCYLTLSPEQEGAQAAKHIFETGFKYPLVLAPKGKLGERITEAFTEKWNELSNTPVASTPFGNRAELQKNVKDAFGLTDSQARINQIRQISNIEMETEARSRRDIDSVYIIANRSELTLLKPFIEVAINPDAKPPKLFSNSSSNNGKARAYQDVSGIVFSDIPMLLDKDNVELAEYDNLWPKSSNTEKRLHALGMDSYSLLAQLPTMKVVQSYQYQGQTGTLSIDDQCVVQRDLSWAEHEAFQSEDKK